MHFKKRLLLGLLSAAMIMGCGWTKAARGGAAGAAAGGAAGAVIGDRTGNTAAGAIIGAAVGGAAGAAIGRYMDRQAAELEAALENARVERVGEGIKITFASGILFDFDSDDLRPESRENLEEMSKVMERYDDTRILVVGHTDSVGDPSYNERLSNERAQSVSRYLTDQGLEDQRIEAQGMGESDPVAENDTAAGRQANRRVEVAIFANEELKRRAEQGELQETQQGN